MSLTAEQRQTLIDSDTLSDGGRRTLQAELVRLTAERDALPHAGETGTTARNGVNRVLFDIAARLAVPDPLPPAEAAAVEARVAARQHQRATVAALQAELLRTDQGSPAHALILNDIAEYSRALADQAGS